MKHIDDGLRRIATKVIPAAEEKRLHDFQQEFGTTHQRLSPRQQEILTLRYGLEDNCGRTLNEVGMLLHIAVSTVMTHERNAYRKLRRWESEARSGK